MSEILPVQISNSNDGQGHRWYRTANARKGFEQVLKMAGFVRSPFDFPVRIVLTRILGKGQRLWDCDSVGRGNAKQLIDALTACGWWKDDGPKWIRPVDFRQDETRREVGPATLIEVYRSEA